MPVIRNPLLNTPSSGNEAIDALVSFLRGSPEDPLTDLANPLAPAVGMARSTGKRLLEVLAKKAEEKGLVVYPSPSRKNVVNS